MLFGPRQPFSFVRSTFRVMPAPLPRQREIGARLALRGDTEPGGETAGVCLGLLSSEGDSRLTDLHKTLASADTTATTVELGLIETQKPAFQFRQLIQRARKQSFSSTR